MYKLSLEELKQYHIRLFWLDVNKTDTCWLWKGALRNGYGCLRRNKQTIYAHRYIYFILGIEIPKGYKVDHKCFNRACCNPEHLEIVLPIINKQRCSKHWTPIKRAQKKLKRNPETVED